jgi:hypothetical protein
VARSSGLTPAPDNLSSSALPFTQKLTHFTEKLQAVQIGGGVLVLNLAVM